MEIPKRLEVICDKGTIRYFNFVKEYPFMFLYETEEGIRECFLRQDLGIAPKYTERVRNPEQTI